PPTHPLAPPEGTDKERWPVHQHSRVPHRARADPSPVDRQGESMIVGIDVHKRSHAAALVDERGAPIATVTIPNSRAGAARLCRWLSEQCADAATIGVENAGGYGRLLCAVLVAAGYGVVNVPAWRVKRERVHEGPGKSDPGDAIAIAQCVLRNR